MIRRLAFFGTVLCIILLFSGCTSENISPAQTEAPVEEPKTTDLTNTSPTTIENPVEETNPVPQTNIWNSDGIISQNEYKNSKEFENGRYTIYWFNDDEFIHMAIKGQTSGWVSIGFEPTQAMKDADMIFGWTTGGSPTILDLYSTGVFGPHPPDQQLGGTNDLIENSGSEAGGFTIIEFKRKLNTGDQYDKAFVKGQNIGIIWGIGSSDSLDSPHTSRGSGTIKLD
jgi:hypothetical protein